MLIVLLTTSYAIAARCDTVKPVLRHCRPFFASNLSVCLKKGLAKKGWQSWPGKISSSLRRVLSSLCIIWVEKCSNLVRAKDNKISYVF